VPAVPDVSEFLRNLYYILSIIPIALSKRENRVEGIKIKKYIESFIKT
jgi:hypothetical protein